MRTAVQSGVLKVLGGTLSLALPAKELNSLAFLKDSVLYVHIWVSYLIDS